MKLHVCIAVLVLPFFSGANQCEGGELWSDGLPPRRYFSDRLARELCTAITNQDIGSVRRLVKDGANINEKGKGGITPLFWCLPDGDRGILEFLLHSGGNPDLQAWVPFQQLRELDPVSVTQLGMKNLGIDDASLILDFTNDINQVDKRGNSLLHFTIKSLLNSEAKARLLISKGIGLNSKNIMGHTPLLLAIFLERHSLTLTLLKNGADAGIPNRQCLLPIHSFIWMQRRPIFIVGPQAFIYYGPSQTEAMGTELVTRMFKEKGYWRSDARNEVYEYHRILHSEGPESAREFTRKWTGN